MTFRSDIRHRIQSKARIRKVRAFFCLCATLRQLHKSRRLWASKRSNSQQEVLESARLASAKQRLGAMTFTTALVRAASQFCPVRRRRHTPLFPYIRYGNIKDHRCLARQRGAKPGGQQLSKPNIPKRERGS
jgi:hypothetical protein